MLIQALIIILRHCPRPLETRGSPEGGPSRKARNARRFFSATLLATVAALVLWGFEGLGPGAGAASARRRHVVVVSVDGMGSSFYVAPPAGLRIPNLRRLMEQGSHAEGVEGVYPTLTYPAHTTLVTGRLPAEHGIYTNLSARAPGANSRDWFWFANAIKVHTLWDEARRAHLSTATVGWPVTAGASVDWDIPEIWNPQKGTVADPLYMAKYMNPLVAVEVLGALGTPQPGSDNDVVRNRLATYFLEKHKPDLLLLHLVALDEAEHSSGPQSPAAATTLERIDARIGELLAAIKRAGLDGVTDVFIVSDHGFLPVDRDIAPNILLAAAGLLTATGPGKGPVFTVSNGGSFFIYWPEGQDLRPEIDAALKPLRERGLVWSIFDREALKELGADPEAQMALEAPEGSFFSSRSSGELVVNVTHQGTHGFLPFRQGLEASFIAWGPGIKRGANLHRIRMTSIAPTILRDLGIDDPKFGDEAPLVEIFR